MTKQIGFPLAATLLILATNIQAAEIKGKVVEVKDGMVTVKVDKEFVPSPGDKVEIVAEIPGLDDVAMVATGKVTRVTGDLVLVKIDRSAGEVKKDQIARISSEQPRKRTEAVGGSEPALKLPVAVKPEDVIDQIVAISKLEEGSKGAEEAGLSIMAAEAQKWVKEWTGQIKVWGDALKTFNEALNEKFGKDPNALPDPPPAPRGVRAEIVAKEVKAEGRVEFNVKFMSTAAQGQQMTLQDKITVIREGGGWKWLPGEFADKDERYRNDEIKKLKAQTALDLQLAEAVKSGKYRSRDEALLARFDARGKIESGR